MENLNWNGPYTIREVLEKQIIPENKKTIYMVSSEKEYDFTDNQNPLYIGSSGRMNVFRSRVRIGVLIMCSLGFYKERNNKKAILKDIASISCSQK